MVGSLIPRAQRVWQSSQHVRFNDSNWLPLIISNFQLLELVFNDPVFILVVHNERRLRWQCSALSEWCSCWSAPDTLTCMNLQKKNCVSSWQIWFHCVTYTKMRKQRRQSLRANKLNMAKKYRKLRWFVNPGNSLLSVQIFYCCANPPRPLCVWWKHFTTISSMRNEIYFLCWVFDTTRMLRFSHEGEINAII